MEKSLLLLDGNNMAFRSAAVLDLTNDAGVSVSVPFGVIRTVKYCLDKFTPNRVIVVWDGGRSKARVDVLSEYKQSEHRVRNREQFLDKNIFDGMTVAKQLLGLLGIDQYMGVGHEADDIIAWYAYNYDSYDITIASSDKDFWQLINDRVRVFHFTKDAIITKQNFQEVTGVPISQEQYLYYHILMGDKSDNIPGIPGVGKKTVIGLLQRYGNLDNMIKAYKKDQSQFNSRELKVFYESSRDIINRNKSLIYLHGFVGGWEELPKNVLRVPPPSFEGFRRRILKPDLLFRSITKDFNMWVLPFRKLKIRSRRKAF